MSEHKFDPATGYCQRCGVLKGSHAEKCDAPANLISLQPYLAKRRSERSGPDPASDPIGYLEARWKEGKLVEWAFPEQPA